MISFQWNCLKVTGLYQMQLQHLSETIWVKIRVICSLNLSCVGVMIRSTLEFFGRARNMIARDLLNPDTFGVAAPDAAIIKREKSGHLLAYAALGVAVFFLIKWINDSQIWSPPLETEMEK